jgi:hypothetical protein
MGEVPSSRMFRYLLRVQLHNMTMFSQFPHWDMFEFNRHHFTVDAGTVLFGRKRCKSPIQLRLAIFLSVWCCRGAKTISITALVPARAASCSVMVMGPNGRGLGPLLNFRILRELNSKDATVRKGCIPFPHLSSLPHPSQTPRVQIDHHAYRFRPRFPFGT